MQYGLRQIFISLTVLLAVAGGARIAAAQDVIYFRIGAGPVFGSYFVVGETLGGLISNPPGSPRCDQGGRCGVPNMVASGQASAGSLANISDVLAGRVESGLAQADSIQAVAGSKDGAGLRVLANLYPEEAHLIARRGAGIKSVAGLRGKRVSIDTRQSGTNGEARRILAAFGVKLAEIKLAEIDPGLAAERLTRGDLDAIFFVGGAPTPGIADMAGRGGIELIPINGPGRDRLLKKYPLLRASEIPADAYKNLPATQTVSINAQWVVSVRMSDDLAYRITAALWHPRNRARLDRAHPETRLIRPETALLDLGAPLHPGAARWYREQGLLKVGQ